MELETQRVQRSDKPNSPGITRCVNVIDSVEEISRRADAIREWLLSDRPQIRGGDHDGGVLGWVPPEPRDRFVYPEAIGYYLTAMAFIVAEDARLAAPCAERASRALAWLERHERWSTREYLGKHSVEDWRNSAVFVFDLGMLLAGISHWTKDSHTVSQALRLESRVVAELESMPWFAGGLTSHRMRVDRDTSPLPLRWSTSPGPHLVKVAAIIAAVPSLRSRRVLLDIAERTMCHWTSLVESHSGRIEVHPTLYYLEGLALDASTSARGVPLVPLRKVLGRIFSGQLAEGDLPEQLNPSAGPRRADVTAQALRLCAVVMGSAEYRDDDALHVRAQGFYRALVGHYLDGDGGIVSFPRHSECNGLAHPVNVWATIFAYQALRFYEAAVQQGNVPMAWLHRIA